MNVVFPPPHHRGLDLLAAHCASLDVSRDPGIPSARERLDAAVGTELAGKLVFALSAAGSPRRERFAA